MNQTEHSGVTVYVQSLVAAIRAHRRLTGEPTPSVEVREATELPLPHRILLR